MKGRNAANLSACRFFAEALRGVEERTRTNNEIGAGCQRNGDSGTAAVAAGGW